MKLRDSLDNYYYYSGKASDIARQLGFAGLAIIWIFRIEGGASSSLVPKKLTVPAALIVSALACDLLQYVAGAAIWAIYHRRKSMGVMGSWSFWRLGPSIGHLCYFFG